MAPKKKKDQVVIEIKSKDNLDDQVIEIAPVDPFLDLRYTPHTLWQPKSRPDSKLKTVLVLKKRRLPPIAPTLQTSGEGDQVVEVKSEIPGKGYSGFYLSQKYKEAPCPNMLSIHAIESKPLSKWFSPGELPMIPPPFAVLRRRPTETSDLAHELETSFRKEKRNLEVFEETKMKEAEMENYVMKKIVKTRETLLLRRQQHLPHLQKTGLERTIMRIERTETPEEILDTDMFCEVANLIKDKNGIRPTLTRREKGYNVVTDWVGYPEVTDIIALKLGLRSRRVNNKAKPEEMQDWSEDREFIPRCEELGINGLNYDLVQQQLQDAVPTKSVEAAKTGFSTSDTFKSKYDTGKGTTQTFSKQEEGSGQGEPKVGLAIGQIKLFWTRDPERALKKWCVELGCTAEIGRDSIASITMANIGSVVVRFKWAKYPPVNAFNLRKYELRRFVFDCWGGVILPGETFRVPVLYKCTEPGFYSEDWRLITQPVMENGAEVIVRLWGITRLYDPYRPVRQRIDENLLYRIGRSIVEHRVTKIVDYLPLKEVPLKDTRFPLVHLGPDLFHLNNPWLKYHCASVYRLGKLAAMTEFKRESRELPYPDKSKTSTVGSDIDPTMSDFHVAFKHDEHQIRFHGDEIASDEEYNIDMPHSSSYAISVLSEEEEFPSILGLKRQIEEQISPENPIVTFTTQEPVEIENDYDDDALHQRKTPMAINLTNPDFVVDQVRQNILDNTQFTRELKEAEFLILSEQVARLLFRTDVPMENWKEIVSRGLLCNAMDSFSDFATVLKVKCCEAEMIEHMFESTVTHSVSSIESAESEANLEIDRSSSESLMDASESWSLSCLDKLPRYAFQSLRFQDEYCTRLYCHMYSLLSDFVDSLDTLLTVTKVLELPQEQVGFTRIRNIPMNFSVADLLNAPLPPKWVKMAQRMDNTVMKNRARKEALDEGL